MEQYTGIVLNIPHSSTFMPVNDWVGDIHKHIEHWTDKFTDIIFKPNNNERVKPVICPVSRFYCDCERLFNDPLETQGQGLYYTLFEDCTRTGEGKSNAIFLWQWYQYLLASKIEEHNLIIDCHSFPSEVAPLTHICIGYNEDWSKPSQEVIDFVVNYFLDYGYNVDINCPYSNSITPAANVPYKSLMIEVNKKVYLDENGELKGSAYKLNQCLNYLYKELLK